MKFPNYGGRSQEISVRLAKARLDAIERNELKENRAELVGNVHFMEEQTSFIAVKTLGSYQSAVVAQPTSIDEDTNAAVIARTCLEDVFGNGTPVNNPFGIGSSHNGFPMFDYEGRTAFYHGYYAPANDYRRNMSWELFNPVMLHSKLPIMSRSFEMNVTGGSGFDRDAFIYYSSNAVFNLTGNQSHALWFKATAIAETSEAFTYLHYRYIDASNWYAIVYETASPNHILGFVTEAGATTKREVTTQDVFAAGNNGWHLLIWTYSPSTNALTIKHNNVADSTTPADTLAAPYTTDTNMYIGNIPTQNVKRIEGYLGPYCMWNIILSAAQQTNFWESGTIV